VTVPIYDYLCRQCQHSFELLVLTGTAVRCPSCGAEDLERLLSSFAVSTTGTRGQSLSAIRRTNAGKNRDAVHAEREYDRNHRHDID
jgi:putative FmdB family regulatory protein